jgi:hypothetical protein
VIFGNNATVGCNQCNVNIAVNHPASRDETHWLRSVFDPPRYIVEEIQSGELIKNNPRTGKTLFPFLLQSQQVPKLQKYDKRLNRDGRRSRSYNNRINNIIYCFMNNFFHHFYLYSYIISSFIYLRSFYFIF